MSSSREDLGHSVRADAGHWWKRPVVLAGLVVIAVLVVGLPRLLAPSSEDAPSGQVVSAQGDTGTTPGLPQGSERQPQDLLDAAARAQLEAEPGREATDEPPAPNLAGLAYAAREVSGQVITADGSPLPDDLVVFASLWAPYPRDVQMGGRGGMQRDIAADYAVPAEFEEAGFDTRDGGLAIRADVRVEVEADGSFVLAGVPVSGAYLGVEHAWWYAEEPPRIESEAQHVELRILQGARIEGHVFDTDGSPLAHAKVEVHSSFNPYDFIQKGMRIIKVEASESAADGHFVISPLPAGSGLTLRAWRDDRAPATSEVPELHPGGLWQVDLTLPDGARIAGRVLDLEDQPVADVSLRLQPASISITDISMDEGTWNTTAVSDDDGRFAFDGLDGGGFVVRMASKRFRLAASDTITLEVGGSVEDVILRADPGLSVSGIIEDQEGRPLPNAWVRGIRPPSFMDPMGGMQQGLRLGTNSDAMGRFRLSGFEEGKVALTARLQGFITARETVEAGDSDQHLILRPTSLLSGLVLSMVDGEPVPHFTVGLMPKGGMFDMADMLNMESRMERMLRPRAFHQDTGEFALEGVVPGEYVLSVKAQGYGNSEVSGILVQAGQDSPGVIVVLPPECSVSGVVLDAVTGEPLADVSVTTGDAGIMSMISMAIGGGDHSAVSDADGRFTLGGLGTKPFKLTLRHDVHADLGLGELQLGYAEVRDLGMLHMSPGASVYGHVYDAHGRALPDVPVMVSEVMGKSMRNARTDETGAYRVQGLPPGSYNVMRLDFAFTMDSKNPADFMQDMVLEAVQLSADEERRVDLSVSTGGAIVQGRVHDRNGDPVPAMVLLTAERGAAPRFASTDEDGRYKLERINEGRYTLSAIPMEGTPMSGGNQPASTAVERLRVLGDITVQRDIVMSGGVLRVVLRDVDGGRLLPGVRVILERTDAGRPQVPLMELTGWRVGESYSNPEGMAEFRYLPDGIYTVVAGGQNILGMGAGGWAVTRHPEVRVVEGEQAFTLRLELQSAGALHGVVRDTSGNPVSDAAIWARGPDGAWLSTFAEVYSDSAGNFTLNSLGDGVWTLAVRSPAHALLLKQGLRVRAGETLEAAFRLEPGVQVLVDAVDFDLATVDWEIQGPYGRVPTELSSLTSITQPYSANGHYDLGRFQAGEYQFTGVQGHQVVYQEELVLSFQRDPEVVLLTTP